MGFLARALFWCYVRALTTNFYSNCGEYVEGFIKSWGHFWLNFVAVTVNMFWDLEWGLFKLTFVVVIVYMLWGLEKIFWLLVPVSFAASMPYSYFWISTSWAIFWYKNFSCCLKKVVGGGCCCMVKKWGDKNWGHFQCSYEEVWVIVLWGLQWGHFLRAL